MLCGMKPLPQCEPICSEITPARACTQWQVARARAREGHLGVVSLVSVGQRLLESLQLGDIGGTMRWALDQCPLGEIANEIKTRYFVPSDQSHRGSSDLPAPPSLPAEPHRSSLLLVGAFAEVFLAKHGHAGRIGIAWPDQTDLDDLAVLSGAMLARVDCVLVPPDAAPFVTQAIDLIAADDFAAWTSRMTGTAILPSVMVVDSASLVWQTSQNAFRSRRRVTASATRTCRNRRATLPPAVGARAALRHVSVLHPESAPTSATTSRS